MPGAAGERLADGLGHEVLGVGDRSFLRPVPGQAASLRGRVCTACPVGVSRPYPRSREFEGRDGIVEDVGGGALSMSPLTTICGGRTGIRRLPRGHAGRLAEGG